MPLQSTRHLHVITSLVLLDSSIALRTLLGIRQDPVGSLTFILTLQKQTKRVVIEIGETGHWGRIPEEKRRKLAKTIGLN